jgi:thioredoxin 1
MRRGGVKHERHIHNSAARMQGIREVLMDKKFANLYYGLGVTALVVVSLVGVLVVMTGHNRAQVSSVVSMVESDSTGQTTLDSVSEARLEEEVDERDEEQPLSNEVPAEKNDSEVPLITENPLAKALRSKRPVLADFGRGTCIPCKMMQPILEKLREEYTGRAEILILDVGEHASLSRKYRIMMIPTQIFFDSSGKEVSRHQGFMAEEDIVTQLKLMGVE